MSTENTDLLGGLNIFGQTVEEVAVTIEEEVYEGGNYIPHLELNPQGTQDSKDMAIVKLIPTLVQGGKNIVKKVSYKVNSDDGKKFFFDSAKSLGWRDNDCVVADMYDKVKDDAAKKARFGRIFNYKKPATVLVQVLKYDTDPTLVGRILPLRIQEDVEKLIQSAITPSKEDIELNDVQPNNVYDLFTGNALMLQAGLKTIGTDKDGKPRKGRTFEDSKFVKASAYKHFLMPKVDAEGNKITKMIGETEVFEYEKVELTADELKDYTAKNFTGDLLAKLNKIVTYLKDEDTPKVEDYGYNEPSDDRKKMINTLIEAILNGTEANLNGGTTTEGGEATSDEASSENVAENVAENTASDATSDDELAGIIAAAQG